MAIRLLCRRMSTGPTGAVCLLGELVLEGVDLEVTALHHFAQFVLHSVFGPQLIVFLLQTVDLESQLFVAVSVPLQLLDLPSIVYTFYNITAAF